MSIPPAGRKPAHDELSLAELIHTVYRHRWLLLGSMLLAGLAGIGFIAAATPVYVAKALLIIEPDTAARSGTTVAAAGQTPDSASVDSQVQILASRSLAHEVVRTLQLDTDPELLGTAKAGILDRLLGTSPAAEARAPAASGGPLAGLLPVPLAAPTTGEMPPTDVVAQFLDRLTVRREGKSHVIAVAYSSGDPARAAWIANKLAELYMAGQLARKQEAARRATGRFDEQLASLKRQLDTAETALGTFRAETEQLRGQTIGVSAVEIAELNRQLVAAEVERSGKEARLDRLRRLALSQEASMALAELGATGLLDQLNIAKTDLLRREAELAAQYGERHPKIVDIRAEKAQLDARIGQERQALLRQFEAEVEAARVKEQELARRLEELKGNALRQEATDRRMAELSREVELNRRLYESYLTRTSTAEPHEEWHEPDARVISEAVAPDVPNFPKPKLILSLSLTGGFLFGLCAMYLAESRERGLQSAGAVEALLGVPVLALVPQLDPADHDGIAPQDYAVERPRSRYAEAVREIVAALQLRQVRDPARTAAGADVILVTSSIPGEGKSTLALSLARMAAAEGLRVLLIDADLRRPALHELVGLKQGPGLVEVLRREVPLSDVLAGDPRGTLKLLPGSRRLTQPTRLLGPDGIGALLAAIRRNFDLIVLDSAPLIAVADAKLMARLADQILFVVRYRNTDRAFCRLSLRSLTEAGVPVTGAVLTRVDLRRHACSGASDAGFAYAKLGQYYVER